MEYFIQSGWIGENHKDEQDDDSQKDKIDYHNLSDWIHERKLWSQSLSLRPTTKQRLWPSRIGCLNIQYISNPISLFQFSRYIVEKRSTHHKVLFLGRSKCINISSCPIESKFQTLCKDVNSFKMHLYRHFSLSIFTKNWSYIHHWWVLIYGLLLQVLTNIIQQTVA